MNANTNTLANPERRAFERVPIQVFGRCLLSNKLELPVQAINMSPGDLAVIAAHAPNIGEHIIVYLDDVGRLEGSVTRLFDGGFAMTIKCTARKREKLAARLEWLKAHHEFGKESMREHARHEVENQNGDVHLPDGRRYIVDVIDISLSGAALRMDVKPALGTEVEFSGLKGSVVRHFAEGIAIQFDTIADPEIFKRFS